MKIINENNLVFELRQQAEKIKYRLWIVAPYIGSPTSIRKILGRQWFDNPNVSVRLLTDLSDLNNVDTKTIQLFHERGQVKTLQGLHAKVYIVDDTCLLTSANLTNTAFSKRHEIGIWVEPININDVVTIFEKWWSNANNLQNESLTTVFTRKKNSKEEISKGLPILWDLPNDPGVFIKNLEKRFLNYDRLLADYNDFSKKYSLIQRLWPDSPLYFEIDGLFNYLYHKAPEKPSKEYSKKKARQLTLPDQLNEIKKWASNYKDWNDVMIKNEGRGDDIEWRMSRSRKLQSLLSPANVMTLHEEELKEALSCLNSLHAYPINKTKILNNNNLTDIRDALNQLVSGEGSLASRMNYCNRIKHLGAHSMNEIIGFVYPEKYPLINKNSKSGLRYFGYQIKIYE